MGLGVGLGSFVDGLARGAATGMTMKNNREDRELAAEDRTRRRAIEDERLGWDREDRALQVEERDRVRQNRDDLEAIRTEASAEFQEGVASGEFKPEEFDAFFQQYAVPKMYAELLEQGDIAGADMLKQWSESAAAKKGSRLFASAMFKSNAGDLAGAIDDAIEAGKVQGYIDHEFEFSGKEEIKDSGGNVVGYRITMKNGKGEEIEQDVEAGDVPQVIAMFSNPAAAWQSQVEARAAEKKRGDEIKDFTTKETIKADIADRDSGAEDRATAIKTLRERSDAAATLDPDMTPFDQLGAEAQEEAIQKELGLLKGGQAIVPKPNMIVDNRTGTGLQPSAPGVAAGMGKPASRPIASTGDHRSDLGLALPTEDQAIQQASQLLVNGEHPEKVARILQQTGVDPAKWPAELRAAPVTVVQ